jgi:Protein of unknown function (DUF3618)
LSSDPATANLALAEARAAAARERLNRTIGALQAKLDPRLLAREAMDGLTDSGTKALRTSVDTAKTHPEVVAGVGALAIAWLGRHRIASLFRRRNRRGATADNLARSIPGDWPATAERNDI